MTDLPDKNTHSLSDIARAAGVSVKTVSRVVNGESGISPKMYERVESILNNSNFRSNLAARRMREVGVHTITVVFDETLSSEYLHIILTSVLAVLKEENHRVEIESISSPVILQKFQDIVDRRLTHGILLLPPVSENSDLIDKIVSQKIPCVSVSSSLQRCDITNVTIDDYAAGQMIGRHLLDSGCSTVGWISLPASHKRANQRELGLIDELQKRNSLGRFIRCGGDGTFASGYRQGKDMLSAKIRPSAIFAGNDYMGLGVLSAAKELNLRVPEDVSVCGFDGGEIADLANPSLTTIRQPISKIGEQAAALLLQKLKLEKTPLGVIKLDFEFIEGNSS